MPTGCADIDGITAHDRASAPVPDTRTRFTSMAPTPEGDDQ